MSDLFQILYILWSLLQWWLFTIAVVLIVGFPVMYIIGYFVEKHENNHSK